MLLVLKVDIVSGELMCAAATGRLHLVWFTNAGAHQQLYKRSRQQVAAVHA